MAEEKVGFGFEFGIKGDKEVKRGLEDIIRLMGTAGNATSALTGILSKAGGLLEFGSAAGAIGLAATAMGIFAYKSAEAGENLRRTRFEIDRLSKMPALALTDSDLSSNESAIVEQFKNLGLEAGNTFNLSLLDRLKNFGRGAYAVNWDIQAAVANLFGANMPSYEQTSPEAQDAKNRISEDQKVSTDRINMATQTQQSLAAIRRRAALDTQQLSSLNYGARPGQPGTGIMPESFAGRAIQRDIRRSSDTQSDAVIQKQVTFDQQQLSNLRNAPLPTIPGTNPADNLKDMAKRAGDIQSLEGKINDELSKQLDIRQDMLELNLQERQIARDFIKGQNYGSWRAVGGGGVAYIPPNFLGVNHKISGPMPKDVGYDTSAHSKAIGLAGVPTEAGKAQAAATSLSGLAGAFGGEIVGVVNAFKTDLTQATAALESFAKKLFSFGDKTGEVIGHAVRGAVSAPVNILKGAEHIGEKAGAAIKNMIEGKGVPMASQYKIDPATFRHLTASYFPSPHGLMSDSPVDLENGSINPATGKQGRSSKWTTYRDSNFPKPHMAGDVGSISPSILGVNELHPSIVAKLREGFAGPADADSRSKYAATLAGYHHGYAGRNAPDGQSYMDAMRNGNATASWTTQPFNHGSLRALNPLGDMNKRVQGWAHPMPGFGGVSGSIQGLDVLKSIDKNINKVGIPTLTQ